MASGVGLLLVPVRTGVKNHIGSSHLMGKPLGSAGLGTTATHPRRRRLIRDDGDDEDPGAVRSGVRTAPGLGQHNDEPGRCVTGSAGSAAGRLRDLPAATRRQPLTRPNATFDE
jgi:hypothetical protein